MNTNPRVHRRTERFEAIVVGGGQAGLAAAHHLANHDVDFAILTDEANVGDNWRRRWDTLRLFTPARYSGLPGLPFPAPPQHLPDKEEVADYLQRYAERFELPVRTSSRVKRATREDGRCVIEVDGSNTRLEASHLIIATGPFQGPRIPATSGKLRPTITQIHSSQYRNPFELPAGSVLVVGAGNSGAQIALELARYRKVWLAGRDTGHLPRRFLGRDLFAWAWPLINYATTDTALGRRIRTKAQGCGDPLIGIPEREIAAAGIQRVGRIDGERGGLPISGTTALEPDVIVWCTGFTSDYEWLRVAGPDGEAAPVGAEGRPRHNRGVSLDVPGLYFVGLRFQHRMSSALLGGVGDDAAYVAAEVARRCEAALL